MSLPNYNSAPSDVKVVRRYFIGTTVLRNGQVLGLDHDAPTNGDPKLRLGYAVEALNANNVTRFAGIVTPSSAGQQGPCYVDLYVPHPGDVVRAEVNGVTDVTAGAVLEPDATSGALVAGTAALGENLFRALEAQTADANVAILVQKI
jgi:hypothetical protein